MRNMEVSKELKADIDANQNLLKTAIRNHQVSLVAALCFLHVASHSHRTLVSRTGRSTKTKLSNVSIFRNYYIANVSCKVHSKFEMF